MKNHFLWLLVLLPFTLLSSSFPLLFLLVQFLLLLLFLFLLAQLSPLLPLFLPFLLLLLPLLLWFASFCSWCCPQSLRGIWYSYWSSFESKDKRPEDNTIGSILPLLVQCSIQRSGLETTITTNIFPLPPSLHP